MYNDSNVYLPHDYHLQCSLGIYFVFNTLPLTWLHESDFEQCQVCFRIHSTVTGTDNAHCCVQWVTFQVTDTEILILPVSKHVLLHCSRMWMWTFLRTFLLLIVKDLFWLWHFIKWQYQQIEFLESSRWIFYIMCKIKMTTERLWCPDFKIIIHKCKIEISATGAIYSGGEKSVNLVKNKWVKTRQSSKQQEPFTWNDL